MANDPSHYLIVKVKKIGSLQIIFQLICRYLSDSDQTNLI